MLKQLKHSSWQSTGKQLREATKQTITLGLESKEKLQTCVNLEEKGELKIMITRLKYRVTFILTSGNEVSREKGKKEDLK